MVGEMLLLIADGADVVFVHVLWSWLQQEGPGIAVSIVASLTVANLPY